MARGADKQGLFSGGLLIVLLAALGIGAPFRSSQPSQDSTATSPTAESAVIHDRHSAEGLLAEFFDINPDQPDSAEPWENHDRWPPPNGSWGKDPRGRDRIQFLIATLPDPAYPPLRYQFDRYVGAIQAALATDNYVLDRFDLPWFDESAAKAADSGKAQITSKGEAKRAARPGVMLFRRDEGSQDAKSEALLVVFIVGETPTSGVNAPALRDALAQIAWLSGWSDGRESAAPKAIRDLTRDAKKHEVWIIGPTFSGSATSLEGVLRTWRATAGLNPPPKAHLISGTATAISGWPPELGDFHSTVIPDSATRREIVKYFLDQRRERRIAIMVEEGTSYGHAYYAESNSGSNRDSNRGSKSAPGDGRYETSVAKPDGASREDDILLLRFPLHISDLRVATVKSGGAENEHSGNLSPLSHHDLPLPLEQGAGGAADVAPSFSRRSVVSDEHVLKTLLSAIRDEDIHDVGIIATDVEDAIFLVQQIRRNCPNVTPFLTSADLLYLHSHVNPDLEGTLIFSTYSLFLPNQAWTRPFAGTRRPIEFPSDYAEGVYNAVLAQLGKYKQMVDYATPFPAISPNSPPSRFPPLWVGIVGRDSMWPVEARPVTKPEENDKLASPNGDPSSLNDDASSTTDSSPSEVSPGFGFNAYPGSLKAAFSLVMLLCLLPNVWILALLRPVRRLCGFGRLPGRSGPGWRQWMVLAAGDGCDRRRLLDRRLYLLSFALVLLTTYIVTISVWTLPLRTAWALNSVASVFGNHGSAEFSLFIFSLFAAGVVGAVAVASVVAISCDTWRHWRSAPGPVSWVAFVTAFASFFSVFLGIALAGAMWSGGVFDSLLFFVRAATIWNGVSPLLPLLFLAVTALLLSIGELRRLSLLEACPLPARFLGLTEPSFEGVERRERRIVDLLNTPAERLPGKLLLIATVVGLFAFSVVVKDAPWPVDGKTFWIFFVLVAAFTYGAFLFLFIRFVSVWREVRGLLYRLYFHPTRQAYKKLRSASVPPTLAHEQKIRLFEAPGSLTAVEFCLEQARRLINGSAQEIPEGPREASLERCGLISVQGAAGSRREIASALAPALADAEQALMRVLRDEACGAWSHTLRQRWELQRRMADLSAIVARISEPKWRLEVAGRDTTADDDSNASLRQTAELFIAGRVVDFLRQVFPQMLNLALFASAGLLALLLAASSYPFPLRDTLSLFSWAVMLVVAAITVGVFVQINRDRVVSMLTGSTPGRLNWESGLVAQVFIFAVLPIMTLLGAQFPYKLQEIFNWLGGMTGNLH